MQGFHHQAHQLSQDESSPYKIRHRRQTSKFCKKLTVFYSSQIVSTFKNHADKIGNVRSVCLQTDNLGQTVQVSIYHIHIQQFSAEFSGHSDHLNSALNCWVCMSARSGRAAAHCVSAQASRTIRPRSSAGNASLCFFARKQHYLSMQHVWQILSFWNDCSRKITRSKIIENKRMVIRHFCTWANGPLDRIIFLPLRSSHKRSKNWRISQTSLRPLLLSCKTTLINVVFTNFNFLKQVIRIQEK